MGVQCLCVCDAMELLWLHEVHLPEFPWLSRSNEPCRSPKSLAIFGIMLLDCLRSPCVNHRIQVTFCLGIELQSASASLFSRTGKARALNVCEITRHVRHTLLCCTLELSEHDTCVHSKQGQLDRQEAVMITCRSPFKAPECPALPRSMRESTLGGARSARGYYHERERIQ